jgi:two-component system, chemotaxis family, chemotaxis protein CheY
MALNVLVVDDSDVIRSMILKSLRIADVPIAAAFEASNGREALSVLEDNWVDVVIADINMPVMDGLEMLRRIRASGPIADTPVIVVTTEGSTSRVTELADAGVSAFVRKPFTPERIRDVVLEVTTGVDAVTEDPVPVLQQVLVDVIARFVLMDAALTDAALTAPDPVDGPILEARMSFRGRESGVVSVLAPYRVCVEMAANAMGVDVGHPRAAATAGDVLGEVLNMTCGCYCVERDPDTPADLAPPTVERVDDEAWASLAASPGTLAFDVEGCPVLLSHSIRGRR